MLEQDGNSPRKMAKIRGSSFFAKPGAVTLLRFRRGPAIEQNCDAQRRETARCAMDSHRHDLGRLCGTLSGRYAEALQCFAQVRDPGITPNFFLHWYWRMQARLGSSEVRLQAGDIPNARIEVDDLLESALSTADPHICRHSPGR